ncbi:Crp-like helix-turn-helix protein [Halomonas ventosae]|uniref:Crp-like helix-turn-helix protein n=1 Tax=Halomonas ventosae TaxID=229007 RepID=A0A4R6HYN2_9GAMM|nr:Crp-like helix-turn-helix protein [Halomonas ventosae]
MSQRLLGEILGLSPVHVNRTLKALEEDRVLKKRNAHIEIFDLPRLIRESAFDAEYLNDDLNGLKARLARL